jgi:Iron-containing redox enzyme
MCTEQLLQPLLPDPCGPVSSVVIGLLGERLPTAYLARIQLPLANVDPFGLDLQMALYVCYELHYRGFADTDEKWEWNPALLDVRHRIEERFLASVRELVGEITPDCTAEAELDRCEIEAVDDSNLSVYLQDQATWPQMQEYFIHRSLYHLKEADPQSWVIPRLTGRAKAAFVAVEYDEYGGGGYGAMHQRLFADLLDAAGLCDDYLHYLGNATGSTLAAVNLMSMFGLHRHLRGAAVGHFAATELTSSPGSHRIVKGLKRLGAPRPCVDFYREHVEADAVHEQVVRKEVVADLLAREPDLDRDVVFGIRAFDAVEGMLATHMLSSWASGCSSLRHWP